MCRHNRDGLVDVQLLSGMGNISWELPFRTRSVSLTPLPFYKSIRLQIFFFYFLCSLSEEGLPP
jgi:hypothetical protein